MAEIKCGDAMANKGAGRYGTHRGAFEKNKRKIYATQSCYGICDRPAASAAGFVMPGGILSCTGLIVRE